ncbi:hypothetical protein DAPPUDRAFT_263728 [Daphnia pulex]|uniref:Uncharacterized protein n=1 Tax=Daphnia pulex TaxID=6669 RepID=E9HQB9_DAPPU|nr:hypothetical protein DAPPUDRAFT_263728 [Daphnia pulex]|eukprot:EFX66061.1 hypothetical protein DAPPUDRAFT_263728 [Daphnia pulex]
MYESPTPALSRQVVTVNCSLNINTTAAEVPIGIARQEIVDLTESDDEEDETAAEDTQSVDSETTERNPHLATEETPSEDSYDADRNPQTRHHPTTRRYAQGQILVDSDITEVEETEVPAEPEEAAAVPVGIARQEIIDLTESDDEHTEETPSEDSDATERNPDLVDEGEHSEEGGDSDPHLSDDEASSGNSGEPDRNPRDAPPPYSPEPPSSRRRDSDRRREFRDGIRSPSPPGYMPSFYLQNLYSPPILLRSEEEYRHHRRELILQANNTNQLE